MIERDCRVCGRSFLARPQGRRNSYCSVPCRYRAKNLRAKFGLFPEDFDRMMRVQRGVCAMPGCSTLLARGQSGCHIDHSHSSGRIRGLLCAPCNVGLGHVEAMVSKGALEYLGRG